MPRPAYYIFAAFSLIIALVSLRALVLPIALVMPAMAHFLTEAPLRMWAHILGGPLALALAPVQLSVRIMTRCPALHRWSGRLYGLAVLIAGLAGLTLAPSSITSGFARSGFMVLALCWLGTTGTGIALAMRGDLAGHRWWMKRSIALTFAAVTLRIMMAPLMANGWTVGETYNITAWGAWLFNLAVLEWWERRRVVRLA